LKSAGLLSGLFVSQQINKHYRARVIGDPLYGSGNKNKSGLKLAATSLQFCCPIQGKNMVFESPQAGFDADIRNRN
jgi:23S rRNA-/tRNA-specific pseudouridylate synthase